MLVNMAATILPLFPRTCPVKSYGSAWFIRRFSVKNPDSGYAFNPDKNLSQNLTQVWPAEAVTGQLPSNLLNNQWSFLLQCPSKYCPVDSIQQILSSKYCLPWQPTGLHNPNQLYNLATCAAIMLRVFKQSQHKIWTSDFSPVWLGRTMENFGWKCRIVCQLHSLAPNSRLESRATSTELFERRIIHVQNVQNTDKRLLISRSSSFSNWPLIYANLITNYDHLITASNGEHSGELPKKNRFSLFSRVVRSVKTHCRRV